MEGLVEIMVNCVNDSSGTLHLPYSLCKRYFFAFNCVYVCMYVCSCLVYSCPVLFSCASICTCLTRCWHYILREEFLYLWQFTYAWYFCLDDITVTLMLISLLDYLEQFRSCHLGKFLKYGGYCWWNCRRDFSVINQTTFIQHNVTAKVFYRRRRHWITQKA